MHEKEKVDESCLEEKVDECRIPRPSLPTLPEKDKQREARDSSNSTQEILSSYAL